MSDITSERLRVTAQMLSDVMLPGAGAEMSVAADMLDAQAARIKELEDYISWQRPLLERAYESSKADAARIKELEAILQLVKDNHPALYDAAMMTVVAAPMAEADHD